MKYKIFFSVAVVFVSACLFAQNSVNKKFGFHTFLGVDVDAYNIKTNGLYVNGVYKGYGAEKAGIQRGDSLMAVGAVSVHNFDELVAALDKYKPGNNVELTIVRNHQSQKINAAVSDYPDFLKYRSVSWLREVKPQTNDEIKVAQLGVDVEPDWERYAVKVTEVIENSGAADAGIETGDVITAMDNYQFATMEELRYYLFKYNPGDVVTLSILHNGESKQVKVNLGEEIIYLNDKKDKDKSKDKS